CRSSALLRLEAAEAVAFDPAGGKAEGARSILVQAKPEPLAATFKDLLRNDNAAVREAAVKLSRLVPAYEELLPQITRLATEERLPAVQVAALETLSYLDRERFLSALVDVLSEPHSGRREEVAEFARLLWEERLTGDEQRQVEAGIRAKQRKQEAALEKFAGTVEWWRHDM